MNIRDKYTLESFLATYDLYGINEGLQFVVKRKELFLELVGKKNLADEILTIMKKQMDKLDKYYDYKNKYPEKMKDKEADSNELINLFASEISTFNDIEILIKSLMQFEFSSSLKLNLAERMRACIKDETDINRVLKHLQPSQYVAFQEAQEEFWGRQKLLDLTPARLSASQARLFASNTQQQYESDVQAPPIPGLREVN